MAEAGTGRVLVVGGTGRLGRLLCQAWIRAGQGGLVWQRRSGPGAGPRFDPLAEPAAYAGAARGAAAILSLAGRAGGSGEDLGSHLPLALAALGAARAAGVPHVFLASSAAVYGAADGAREEDPTRPLSDYARTKVAMEAAARASVAAHPGGPGVTCLRIANVAGADQLLGAAPGTGRQMLDIFADGTGPRRSYIGPAMVAVLLGRLLARAAAGAALPEVLNLALDGAVAMEALLDAAGRAWAPRPAPAGALPLVRLDVGRLASLAGPVPQADAAGIVADLRATRGGMP